MRLTVILTALVVLVASGTSTARPPESNYAKAKRIIYATFPSDTQANALTVVGCETGRTYSQWSYNKGSGATGYFQVLRGNHGRQLRYNGKRFVINGNRLFQPWYNTKAAYYLSKGGHDWHEWSCQPN